MGLNLNLRQIIRNQKTKNFDLISLISEKLTAPEQAAKKGWESAGGGYWKYKDGKTVARTVDDKLVPVSSDDDTTSVKKKRRCGICSKVGHDRRSCTTSMHSEVNHSYATRSKTRRCGLCRGVGHNKRTCPEA